MSATRDVHSPAVLSDRVNATSRVALVGPKVVEAGSLGGDVLKEVVDGCAILDVGLVDNRGNEDAVGVYEDVPLPSIDLLVPVEAAGPPFSVVFALCESTMPADGSGWRPSRWRHIWRS